MASSSFRIFALSALAAFIAPRASAQNGFLLDGGGFIQVIENGGMPFEVFAGYYGDFVEGACQTFDPVVGPVNRLRGFRLVFADIDPSTPETLFLGATGVVDVQGQRQPNLANRLLVTGPITTPTFGTPGVAEAIELSINLATPFDGMPSTDFYITCQVASPEGAIAFQDALLSGNTGANANVPTDMNHAVLAGAGPLPLTFTPGSLLLGFLGDGPTLRVGADVDPARQNGAANPHFGLAGIYPDSSRQDGIAIRVEDSSLPFSAGLLLVNLQPFIPPVSLPSIFAGSFFVAPLVDLPFLLDGNGRFEQTLIPYPFPVPGGVISSYQAVVLPANGTRLRLTNAVNRVE